MKRQNPFSGKNKKKSENFTQHANKFCQEKMALTSYEDKEGLDQHVFSQFDQGFLVGLRKHLTL